MSLGQKKALKVGLDQTFMCVCICNGHQSACVCTDTVKITLEQSFETLLKCFVTYRYHSEGDVAICIKAQLLQLFWSLSKPLPDFEEAINGCQQDLTE